MLALSIACTAAAVVWAYLVVGHGRFWLAAEWLPPRRAEPERWPDVVAVVPARNEAAMLPVTLPALLGQDYPGAPGITRDGRPASAPILAATSAVPSELQSSTRMTLSAPG